MAEIEDKKEIFSLDASALLQIHVFYPSDLFPKVWEAIEAAAEEGRLYVIDKAYAELQRKDDFVHGWLKKRKQKIVKRTKQDCEIKAAEVTSQFEKIIDPDNEYEQADPYIIADAIIVGTVVVTGENPMQEPVPKNRKKDKIPNVCDYYRSHCICNRKNVSPNEFALILFQRLGLKELG